MYDSAVDLLVEGTNDIGGVSIMQMKTGGAWSGPGAGLGTYVGGTNRQDQLYLDLSKIPPPSTVPEPASVAMWSRWQSAECWLVVAEQHRLRSSG